VREPLVGRTSEAHRRLLVDVVVAVTSTDRDHVARIGAVGVPPGDLAKRQPMTGLPGTVTDLGHNDIPAVTKPSVRAEHMMPLRRSGLQVLQLAQDVLVQRAVGGVRRRLVVGILSRLRSRGIPHSGEVLNGAFAEQDLERPFGPVVSQRLGRVPVRSR
jgi:hypothetical protein